MLLIYDQQPQPRKTHIFCKDRLCRYDHPDFALSQSRFGLLAFGWLNQPRHHPDRDVCPFEALLEGLEVLTR